MSTKDVNVTELRQNLPTYLAQVRRGTRIRVTSRGTTIAEITPPAVRASDVARVRARLRGSVKRFDRPLEPIIDAAEWDMHR